MAESVSKEDFGDIFEPETTGLNSPNHASGAPSDYRFGAPSARMVKLRYPGHSCLNGGVLSPYYHGSSAAESVEWDI